MFQFYCTNYIYSNKNPNLIPFSTLTLETRVPRSLFKSFLELPSEGLQCWSTEQRGLVNTLHLEACADVRSTPYARLERKRTNQDVLVREACLLGWRVFTDPCKRIGLPLYLTLYWTIWYRTGQKKEDSETHCWSKSTSWSNRKSQKSRNYGDILIPKLQLQSSYITFDLYGGNGIGHYGHYIWLVWW
jgi:hypothetical protein